MKPKEQRKAIAEACGWIINDDGVTGISPINVEQGLTNPKICSWKLPDYLNDLNAMHEAEKILIEQGFQDRWLDELVEVVVGANVHWSDYHCFPQVNRATATQRAEAFLKTIGKWEGGSEKPVTLIHNGVGIADMYSRDEFENAMKRTNQTSVSDEAAKQNTKNLS
jgi:hypothetical protein